MNSKFDKLFNTIIEEAKVKQQRYYNEEDLREKIEKKGDRDLIKILDWLEEHIHEDYVEWNYLEGRYWVDFDEFWRGCLCDIIPEAGRLDNDYEDEEDETGCLYDAWEGDAQRIIEKYPNIDRFINRYINF